jgi:lambda family phage portal protein
MGYSPDIEALLGSADEGLQSPTGSPASGLVPPNAGGDLAMGAYDGADRFNKTLALWAAPIQSADSAILRDKLTVDARVNDTLRNDAYVVGGQNIHKDNIVGSQFMLNSKPATGVLFGKQDEVWETEFQEEVEEKFDLYAESPDHWIDASRLNTFTGLVRLAVGVDVAGGEVLASAEWLRDFGRPFNTAIQMIDTDRLSTPPDQSFANDVRGGIRRNQYGAPQSYFVRQSHPTDWLWQDSNFYNWTEVPVRKPWGRLQMIHIYEQTRPDQTRGIAAMVAALKEMRITKKFRDVNLQNAVTQATYAATITSELPSESLFASLGGGNLSPELIEKAITDYSMGYLGSIAKYAGSARNLHIDGVKIPHLYPGTKLDLLTPGKGGPLGTEFEQSLLRYIAAVLGVSYEQLSKDYTNTNYSSARAAVNETWKFMQARKKLVADRFASAIYRLWLEEVLNKGLITSMPTASKKDGWLYSNQRLDALSRCEWIGASRGQIDELKETQAAVLRMTNNLSTLEDELGKLGKDYRRSLRQRARELALMESLGIPMPPPPTDTTNQMNAASGTKGTTSNEG